MEEKPLLVPSIDIPPFRIDLGAGCVWRGAKALSLRPKAWAVLLYLVERRGLLVSRAELQSAVWPDAEVCDDNITQSIAELRRVLDDDVRRPRFVETVHRRGYRFVGPVGDAVATPSSSLPSAPAIVSRDAEIATLLGLLRKARSGSRQVAFVIGEPGIGKTSLVDAFLGAATREVEPTLAARGQSVEHYGQHEPFGPIIEALDRLISGPMGSAVLPALKRLAPTWYSELAAARPTGRGDPARSASAPTPGKMLREIAVALETLISGRTLIFVLEDLHWADPSTVDALSVLAQRTEPARLLIVATYRPAEAAVRDHPISRLRRTLEHRARCVQIALEPLPREAVRTYLGIRFADVTRAEEIADWIHRRTEGNPLFMVALVDYLTSRGVIPVGGAEWSQTLTSELENEVPETLRGMIEAQLEALEPRNRDVLEAACAVGAELDAQCVAAALEARVGEVDSTLDHLARTHGLLRVTGEREWPDGSAGGRYVFRHVLYRQTLYARLPPAVRREMHQRIAQRLEAGFGERTAEIAAELAHHFERGGDRPQAIEQLLRGAERALDRGGVREATSFLDAAEPLLACLPASVERDRKELVLLRLRAIVMSGISGYAAAGLEAVLERCRTLAADMKDDAKVFEATRALWYLHGKRGEGDSTWALVAELRRLSTRLDHRCAVLADAALGTTAVWAGNLGAARDALERVEAEVLAGRLTEFEGVGDYSVAPFVEALAHFAHTLWLLGDGARAREVRRVALAAAERLGHAISLSATLEHASLSAWVSGDTEEADALSRRGIELRIEHGLDESNDLCTLFGGAARVQAGRTEEGLAMVRQGLERYTSTAAQLASPMFGALATCCLQAGEIDEGLAVVERALDPVRSTLDRMFEAELWRLKGELLLARDQRGTSPASEGQAEAEDCFARALATSRAQGARGLELRAAASLARLWQQRGDAREAYHLLAPIVASFGEILETPDLCEASRLLQELGAHVRRETA